MLRFLSKLFPSSVDDVVSDLDDIVTKLETIAVNKAEDAERHQQLAAKFEEKAADDAKEQSRALKVAAKVRALIS